MKKKYKGTVGYLKTKKWTRVSQDFKINGKKMTLSFYVQGKLAQIQIAGESLSKWELFKLFFK